MALIQCPHCGGSISEKAVKCVHCGSILREENIKFCAECGAELESGAVVCNKCGCPVEDITPQKVEVTSVKIKTGVSKKTISTIVALAIVAIVGFCGFKVYHDRQLKIQAEMQSKKYADDLQAVTLLMVGGASTAESCGNLIRKVWSNAIYEKSDYETDKYTKIAGSFVDDFNDALLYLFIDDDFSEKIESIKSNQDDVAELMKEMKNPPEEWNDAYNDLKDFYDAYIKFTNLAINPTGSLQSFSSEFNTADTQLMTELGKMKLYFK